MALQITKTSKHGIDLSYWKVVPQNADFHNKSLKAEIWGWVDRDAREALPTIPVEKRLLSWNERLGEDFPFSNASGADEITKQVYSAVMSLEDWSAAVEV